MPLRQLHIHNLSILQAGILPIVANVGKYFLRLVRAGCEQSLYKNTVWYMVYLARGLGQAPKKPCFSASSSACSSHWPASGQPSLTLLAAIDSTCCLLTPFSRQL